MSVRITWGSAELSKMGLRKPPGLKNCWQKHKVLPLAVCLALVLCVSFLWLPEDLSAQCNPPWVPCLSVTAVNQKSPNPLSEVEPIPKEDWPSECPGQDFQVSRLLKHLQAALGQGSDIQLQQYLSCWDELIRFMQALGPVVGFISNQVQAKLSLIRQLAQSHDASYQSVRSMMQTELNSGLVSFSTPTASGCRTLLRLHRALLWLQLFLQRVAEAPDPADNPGEVRSPAELSREAYMQVLAPYHSWLARRAAEMAFLTMPERETLFSLVCAEDQEEAGQLLTRVAMAIREVYQQTQKALEENDMLDLP